MIELSSILQSYGQNYLEKYSDKMPYNHKKAIRDILQCRTPILGGQAYICKDCNELRYSYHSCRNRNCNKCQSDKAEQWLDKSKEILLPVTHFMVTFTLHPLLRDLTRSNQKLFYNLLFKASTLSLQKLAYDSKFVGGRLAMMGILHTWTRTLIYHPHIHFIVPAGGLWQDGSLWLESSRKFLVPVLALSKIFRYEFQKLLKKSEPDLYNSLSKDIWNQSWVVHSQTVGRGEKALKYLSDYVFRPAISNYRILNADNGCVTFKYKDSKTYKQKTLRLSSEEFIRRYLQHVLPNGFVKVRYYGLFSPAYKKQLNAIKEKLSEDIKLKKVEKASLPKVKRQINCPCCGKPMIKATAKAMGLHPLGIDFNNDKAPPALINVIRILSSNHLSYPD